MQAAGILLRNTKKYISNVKTAFYSVALTASGSQRKHALDVAAAQEGRLIYLWLKENVWMTNALAPPFPIPFSYELLVPTHLTFGKQLHRNCTLESNAPGSLQASFYEI